MRVDARGCLSWIIDPQHDLYVRPSLGPCSGKFKGAGLGAGAIEFGSPMDSN
jgi:hypothetical protein